MTIQWRRLASRAGGSIVLILLAIPSHAQDASMPQPAPVPAAFRPAPPPAVPNRKSATVEPSRPGYDQATTHPALTRLAMQRSIVPSYLRTELGMPDGANTVLVEAGVGATTPTLALAQGAVDEDVLFTASGVNCARHFYNPINKQGLHDRELSYDNSLVWAYNDGWWHSPYNWTDIRSAFFSSLIADLPATRADFMARTFKGLGHPLHLVQDLAQPQHTRNDEHLTFAAPSGYESYCAQHYNTASAIDALSGGATRLPRFRHSFNPGGGIPPSFASFWDTNQFRGSATAFTGFDGDPGLAEYSNSNFITDDTMFGGANDLPIGGQFVATLRDGPTNESSSTAHSGLVVPSLLQTSIAGFPPEFGGTKLTLTLDGEDLSDNTGRWPYNYLSYLTNMGELVSHFCGMTTEGTTAEGSWRHLGLAPPTGGTINLIWEDYAKLLLPRAADYSAGLLNYFFRGRLQTRVAYTGQGNVRLTVVNRTVNASADPERPEALFGAWVLLADDPETGVRRTIPATGLPNAVGPNRTFVTNFRVPDDFFGDTYTLVFHGRMGDEEDAVAAKQFKYSMMEGAWEADVPIPPFTPNCSNNVAHCVLVIRRNDPGSDFTTYYGTTNGGGGPTPGTLSATGHWNNGWVDGDVAGEVMHATTWWICPVDGVTVAVPAVFRKTQ
jgi:hypothetical protein